MYRTRQAVENETTTQKTLRVQHGNSKVLLTAKIIVKKKTTRNKISTYGNPVLDHFFDN